MKKKKILFAALLSIVPIQSNKPFGFNVHGNMYIPLDDDALEFICGLQVSSISHLSDIVLAASGGIRFYDEDISAVASLAVPLFGNKMEMKARDWVRHISLSVHVAWELADFPNLMVGIQANFAFSGVGLGIVVSQKIERYEIGGSLYYLKELEFFKEKENKTKVIYRDRYLPNKNENTAQNITSQEALRPDSNDLDNNKKGSNIDDSNYFDENNSNFAPRMVNNRLIKLFLKNTKNLPTTADIQKWKSQNHEMDKFYKSLSIELCSILQQSNTDKNLFESSKEKNNQLVLHQKKLQKNLKDKLIKLGFEKEYLALETDKKQKEILEYININLALKTCGDVFYSEYNDWINLLKPLFTENNQEKICRTLEILMKCKVFEKKAIMDINTKPNFANLFKEQMLKDSFYINYYPASRKEILSDYIKDRCDFQAKILNTYNENPSDSITNIQKILESTDPKEFKKISLYNHQELVYTPKEYCINYLTAILEVYKDENYEKIKKWILENNSTSFKEAKKNLGNNIGSKTFYFVAGLYQQDIENILKHKIKGIQLSSLSIIEYEKISPQIDEDLDKIILKNTSHAVASTKLAFLRNPNRKIHLATLKGSLFYYADGVLMNCQQKEDDLIRVHYDSTKSLNENTTHICEEIQTNKNLPIYSENNIYEILKALSKNKEEDSNNLYNDGYNNNDHDYESEGDESVYFEDDDYKTVEESDAISPRYEITKNEEEEDPGFAGETAPSPLYNQEEKLQEEFTDKINSNAFEEENELSSAQKTDPNTTEKMHNDEEQKSDDEQEESYDPTQRENAIPYNEQEEENFTDEVQAEIEEQNSEHTVAEEAQERLINSTAYIEEGMDTIPKENFENNNDLKDNFEAESKQEIEHKEQLENEEENASENNENDDNKEIESYSENLRDEADDSLSSEEEKEDLEDRIRQDQLNDVLGNLQIVDEQIELMEDEPIEAIENEKQAKKAEETLQLKEQQAELKKQIDDAIDTDEKMLKAILSIIEEDAKINTKNHNQLSLQDLDEVKNNQEKYKQLLAFINKELEAKVKNPAIQKLQNNDVEAALKKYQNLLTDLNRIIDKNQIKTKNNNNIDISNALKSYQAMIKDIQKLTSDGTNLSNSKNPEVLKAYQAMNRYSNMLRALNQTMVQHQNNNRKNKTNKAKNMNHDVNTANQKYYDLIETIIRLNASLEKNKVCNKTAESIAETNKKYERMLKEIDNLILAKAEESETLNKENKERILIEYEKNAENYKKTIKTIQDLTTDDIITAASDVNPIENKEKPKNAKTIEEKIKAIQIGLTKEPYKSIPVKRNLKELYNEAEIMLNCDPSHIREIYKKLHLAKESEILTILKGLSIVEKMMLQRLCKQENDKTILELKSLGKIIHDMNNKNQQYLRLSHQKTNKAFTLEQRIEKNDMFIQDCQFYNAHEFVKDISQNKQIALQRVLEIIYELEAIEGISKRAERKIIKEADKKKKIEEEIMEKRKKAIRIKSVSKTQPKENRETGHATNDGFSTMGTTKDAYNRTKENQKAIKNETYDKKKRATDAYIPTQKN